MSSFNRSIREFPPFMKLLTVAFVSLASFALFMFIGMVTGMALFNIGFDQYAEAMQQPTINAGYLKYMQSIYSIGIFVVPALLLGFLFYSSEGDQMGLHTSKLPHTTTVILAILLVISAMPFINIVGEYNASLRFPDALKNLEQWMRDMENQAMGLTEELLSGTSYQTLAINLIVVALVPALGEEFLFRGVVQRIFFEMTHSPHGAVWLAAALFSFLHFQFFGFFPRLILGVLFGYMLVWSKTIWVPVIAHFANNALAVIFYFFHARGAIGADLDNLGTQEHSFYYLIGSAALLVSVMYAIYRNERILRAGRRAR